MTTENETQTERQSAKWLQPVAYAVAGGIIAAALNFALTTHKPNKHQALMLRELQQAQQQQQTALTDVTTTLRDEKLQLQALTNKLHKLGQRHKRSDILPTYQRINQLRQRIAALTSPTNTHRTQAIHTPTQQQTSTWQAMTDHLKQFFTIRHLSDQSPLLVTPTQQKQLLANAQQSLALSQWALLNHNQAAFAYGVEQAVLRLQTLPHSSAQATLVTDLKQLQMPRTVKENTDAPTD